MWSYRLDCTERWPDRDYKKAVLAAVHSALNTLDAASVSPVAQHRCMLCASRQARAEVLELPSRSQGAIASTPLSNNS
jgi:hypothetical protein